jgi:small-conductance mechanosensitive channel
VGDEIKLDAFEGTVEEIQTRATIIKTYDERRVVIPNADLFTHSVIVNTALDVRRWQYDVNVKNSEGLEKLKSLIVNAVRAVPGVLTDPPPEALVIEIDAAADAAKIRVLWWTRDPHQHQMLASYDRVLTAIIKSLDRSRVDERHNRAA